MKQQKVRQPDLFDLRKLSGVPMPRRLEIVVLLEVLLIEAIRTVTNAAAQTPEAGDDHDHV
jgi:hypothetical protein